MANTDLLTIPRRRGEELRVSLTEYQGHHFLSLREWFETPAGDMRPGKKGCTVPLQCLGDLRAAVFRAENLARAEGLLPPQGEPAPVQTLHPDGVA